METTTRYGSRVIIDAKDDYYLYGRWYDGESEWFPTRWHKDGKFPAVSGVSCGLDLVWKR